MTNSTTSGRVECGESVKAQTGRRKGRTALQPPLTPMIDVTFQLLLFFLLTCEFRESEGAIPGSLPGGTVPHPALVPLPPDPITIRVIASADRLSATYEVTGVATPVTTPRRLGELLTARRELLGTTDVPVVIQPAGQAPWGFVVEAMNQVKKAEYQKVLFSNPT